MTSEEVKNVVLDIIQQIDEDADVSGLKPELALRDQLDLDSMDFLDIVMELRKRYKIQIPEADYPQLATLASCVTYLQPRLQDA